MLCFHGITAKAYEQYKLRQGKSGVVSPWVCSDNDGYTYVWPLSTCCEGVDDPEEARHIGIRLARECALTQASVNNDEKVYVIVVDIPEDVLDVDYSCENMENARYIPENAFYNYNPVEILEFDCPIYWHPFIISGVFDNYQFNKSAINEDLLQFAKVCKGGENSALYDIIYSV